MSQESVKAKFDRARELIRRKDYDGARAILRDVNHPKAQEWLTRIDDLEIGDVDMPVADAPSRPRAELNKRIRGLTWRRRVFWLLALLPALWMCYGLVTTSTVADEMFTENAQTADENTRAAQDAGTAIGASLSLGVFLCTGFPFFLFFALLAWRNGVGISREKHHLETLDAMRRQSGP